MVDEVHCLLLEASLSKIEDPRKRLFDSGGNRRLVHMCSEHTPITPKSALVLT